MELQKVVTALDYKHQKKRGKTVGFPSNENPLRRKQKCNYVKHMMR
jgi:hypothetical protein